MSTRVSWAALRRFALCAALGALALPMSGQANESPNAYVPTLTFDVASVREGKPADSYTVSGGFTPHTSILKVNNFSVENLILEAYGLKGFYQLTGVPRDFRWMMFNVEAKSDGAADEKLSKLTDEQSKSEQEHMLQTLLAERFKMKAHWETIEVPVLNMVVKNPERVSAMMKIPSATENSNDSASKKLPPIYQRGDSNSNFSLIAHQCSIARLIEILSGQFGRPVLDKTGLTGMYDFQVTYHGRFLDETDANSQNPTPPLDEALERQLGLKVEQAKGPLTRLVVDHLEKLSEN